jgi:hypothetical protein
MLRQKYFYVFLISLSLILTLGCSKQSQIETETGQTNVEKKDQSTNQKNTKTASDNDIVTETVALKVSGMT